MDNGERKFVIFMSVPITFRLELTLILLLFLVCSPSGARLILKSSKCYA